MMLGPTANRAALRRFSSQSLDLGTPPVVAEPAGIVEAVG